MTYKFGQPVKINYRGYDGYAFVVTANPSVVEVAYEVPSETRPGCFNHAIMLVGIQDAEKYIFPLQFEEGQLVLCEHCELHPARPDSSYCSDTCEQAVFSPANWPGVVTEE